MADVQSLYDQGIAVTLVDANARGNRVIVGVEAAPQDAEATLRELYGPRVIAQVVGAFQPDCNGSAPFNRWNWDGWLVLICVPS